MYFPGQPARAARVGPMPARIVVAPQAFKGSADAAAVADAIAEGLHEVWPDASIDRVPVADGGEGTVRALVDGADGEMRETTARDPLGHLIRAGFGLIDGGATAVVEMAAASGLTLVAPADRDARLTSSFGTGELLVAAARAGARRILIGVGGSATNDGGAGMLRAVGFRLLDQGGREIGEGGIALERLASIEGMLDPVLAGVELVVATDVASPLTGPNGASAVFGPQKGATADDVRALDAALGHFADVVAWKTKQDLRDAPGAGAAGGVGFALMALLRATARSGADLVLDAARFDERVAVASLCVTGEGRLDAQSLAGKASVVVARRAGRKGVPTVAVVGSLGDGHERALAELAAVEPIAVGPADEATLMREWRPLVRAAAARLARAVQVGTRMASVSGP